MKKQLVSMMALFIILFSCEQASIFGPAKASKFYVVVHNNSNLTMSEVDLFLEETTDNQVNSSNLIEIPLAQINNLSPGDSSDVIAINLKDFSKGNRGQIRIKSSLESGQELDGFGRNYKENFNYADDSYPGFNTIEFYLVDTSSVKGLQLTFTFSKYSKDGKLLKRGTP